MISVLFTIAAILAICLVRGITIMHTEHPEYNGEDLFED